ncbi:hypothetical protein DFJ58DRAFT_847993 [Suillus subalutaceus]|uniref:uncharacterized protein n=1 Tax=Suillus subalutaceus TaxID=48586 RepID=UPI001B875ADB|nr:uncharacterized protein DFJ58DRAFT_847993 [Suillus subalutaceus]KAG1832571.1 hypothetical protein DFJ58DRAFT_847993 [Suillus subalutaceus]
MTWMFVVGLPFISQAYFSLQSNVIPASAHPLRGADFISLALIAGSLALEVTADRQKSTWRYDKQENNLSFPREARVVIQSSYVAYSSYVGVLGIWTGMFDLAAFSGALLVSVLVATAASPLLTCVLLRHASGVPPLERAAETRLGDNKKWQEYKSPLATASIPLASGGFSLHFFSLPLDWNMLLTVSIFRFRWHWDVWLADCRFRESGPVGLALSKHLLVF